MFKRLRDKRGFTLVEIMIVVAIIGLLIAIALPNFVRARNTTRQNLCDNNLRLVGHAAEQYIINGNLADSAVVTKAQAGELVKGGTGGAAFRCPAAGADTYAIASETVGTDSGPTVNCSTHNRTYHILSGQVTSP